MRFLAVHNRHLVAGGEDQSHALEIRLLRERGHEVDELLEDNQAIQHIGLLTASARTVWSQASYQKVRKLLRAKPYTAVLVQNYFPLLSPAIFHACRAESVPVLYFVRNFRMFCLNGLFARQGKVCEDCFGKFIPYPGILHRCYRDSLPGSLVTAGMTVFHRMARTWKNCVDAFVVLNQFTQAKLIASGIPAEKVFLRSNFIYPDPGVGDARRSGVVYVGRLSSEKGIDWLVKTWLDQQFSVPLQVFGSGPLEPQIKSMLTQSKQVELMGQRTSAEILEILGRASVLVLPSLCYEGMPRVVLEAFARGTPVIVSNLGGMSELVQNGKNGYVFAPGNSQDFGDKVRRLLTDEAHWLEISHEARSSYLEKYSAERAYQNLMEILAHVLPHA